MSNITGAASSCAAKSPPALSKICSWFQNQVVSVALQSHGDAVEEIGAGQFDNTAIARNYFALQHRAVRHGNPLGLGPIVAGPSAP